MKKGVLLYFCLWLFLPAASLAQADTPAYATNSDPTLAALVEEALESNPQLRQALLDAQAAQLRIAQVTALPDPSLAVTQHARSPETRVGPQTTVVAISQKFPWFGTLSDRGRIAAKQAGVRDALYQQHRAELVRQIKLAYYDLGYLDRALGITAEQEQLLRHYETLAQARYAQGVGLQQAVVKLQAEITQVLNRRQELLRQRVELEAGLNALCDRPVHTSMPAVRPVERPVVPIDSDRLSAIGRANRPEVKEAVLRIESRQSGVQLARRQYWPDFTLGASWGNVRSRPRAGLNRPPGNGKDVYSLSLSLSLPIFRAKYDAGVQEAIERVAAAKAVHQNVVNTVDAAVRAVGVRLRMTDEQIALFERALLPQAEQALRSTEEAYATGTTGVLELLDSEEVLLEVRLGLARLETDYMQALAEMEHAIGSAFPEERP